MNYEGESVIPSGGGDIARNTAAIEVNRLAINVLSGDVDVLTQFVQDDKQAIAMNTDQISNNVAAIAAIEATAGTAEEVLCEFYAQQRSVGRLTQQQWDGLTHDSNYPLWPNGLGQFNGPIQYQRVITHPYRLNLKLASFDPLLPAQGIEWKPLPQHNVSISFRSRTLVSTSAGTITYCAVWPRVAYYANDELIRVSDDFKMVFTGQSTLIAETDIRIELDMKDIEDEIDLVVVTPYINVRTSVPSSVVQTVVVCENDIRNGLLVQVRPRLVR